MIFLTKTLVFKHYGDTAKLIKENLIFIIIASLFVFGILIGSFSISVCENNDFYGLNSYFNDYIIFINQSSFSELFLNSLFVFSLLVLFNYILGLCVIGNFINVFILLLFSFGIGNVSGFLYRAFSIKGIGFFSLTVLPGLFLFCINYLLSFKQSFTFSKELFKLCKKNAAIKVDFKKYSIKFIVHFVIVFLVSLVFAFFTNTYSSMFDFS